MSKVYKITPDSSRKFAVGQRRSYAERMQELDVVFYLLISLITLAVSWHLGLEARFARYGVAVVLANITLIFLGFAQFVQKMKVTAVLTLCLVLAGQVLYVKRIVESQPSSSAKEKVELCVSETNKQKKRYRRVCDKQIYGTISKRLRSSRPNELRFVVSELESESGTEVQYSVRAPRLPWLLTDDFKVGDRVELRARLYPTFSKTGAPYGLFSPSSRHFRRGIAADGYVKEIYSYRAQATETSLKSRLSIKARHYFDFRNPISLVLASITGDRTLISKPMRDLFKDFGVSHLLVISGFHVGIIFLAIKRFIRPILFYSVRLVLLFPLRPILSLLALGLTAGFVSLSGGELPAVRALIALSSGIFAVSIRDFSWRIKLLMITALGCLFIWPGVYSELSFQLSFMAVLGLSIASLVLDKGGKRALSLKSLFALNFGAWLFTAPVLVLWFGQFCPLGVLWNMLITPIYSAVFIIGGMGLVVPSLMMNWSWVLEVYAGITNPIIDLLWTLGALVRDAGLSQFTVSEGQRLSWAVGLAIGGAIFSIFLWVGRNKRKAAGNTIPVVNLAAKENELLRSEERLRHIA